LDEIKEVNANCILMANLQQASSSGTQTDSALVYDTDGSAEVHENYDDNEIFNMFTQEEQYTELLEPIPEPQQVPHNDNNVISKRISSNPHNRQIAQPNINIGQDRQMQMVRGNDGNQYRQYARNLIGYNDVQNIRNQNGNGNLVATRTEGNAAGQKGNQIRCYNCRGVGHYARNCMVRPRRRDAAYLQT
nr:hypothetical protein [Tanacetum cinerariifolium]